MDGVAVEVVEDEELGVAGAGWEEETAGLVGENLAGGDGGHGGSIAVMGAGLVGDGWKGVGDGFLVVGGRCV